MHRGLLRQTAAGLTDEQARSPTDGQCAEHRRHHQARRGHRGTVVGAVHGRRRGRRRRVPTSTGRILRPEVDRRVPGRLPPAATTETLAGVLADYERVAARDRPAGGRAARPRPLVPAAAGAVVPARRPCAASAVRSCTSSPRPPSTPATPTSSARRSTAPRRWADRSAVRTAVVVGAPDDVEVRLPDLPRRDPRPVASVARGEPRRRPGVWLCSWRHVRTGQTRRARTRRWSRRRSASAGSTRR